MNPSKSEEYGLVVRAIRARRDRDSFRAVIGAARLRNIRDRCGRDGRLRDIGWFESCSESEITSTTAGGVDNCGCVSSLS